MFNSQRVDPAKYGGWEEVLFRDDRYGNHPNEILIAFREDTYAKGTVGEAGSVLEYWEPYLGVLRHQGFEVNDLAKEHARKVLTRLVNVYGEAE